MSAIPMYDQQDRPCSTDFTPRRDSLLPAKPTEVHLASSPDVYHKLLDYHIVEIVMGSIILASVLLLRFYR